MIPQRIKELEAYKTEVTPASVRLSSNEFPYDFPEEIKQRALEELKKVPLNKYPDPEAKELKAVLADFFGVKEENLVLGNGSDELIYYLSIAIGELYIPVYIPVPTFPMYEISAKVLGRPLVKVQLDENFDIDLERSIELIEKEKPVLGYFAYPNNPTGNLFSRGKIEEIRNRGVFCVIDEAYYHYSGETFLEDALKREDTVVLRTLSKIGMASLRVGILIGKGEIVSEINKVRLPFNVTYPSQVMAKVLLTEGREFLMEKIQEVVKERERMYDEMKKIEGVEVFPSKANFLLFRTPYPAHEVYQELLKRDVLVRNVSYMEGLQKCLRVSVGKPEENNKFLEALEESIKSLSSSL
ncbi:histidinol-phosphate transaminase [Aquifex aeolicus]|uniref:Histidinol-phosphate aminotransferase n=1 Tax=Aquifex aeolicus (strain VF5) TaxID=224324 RepID=HIS8_AQUAE|nr:histidinol-phosphate transaminase [Aquifex aeolicus]O67857.1 RecName: Full=Histidinol-phosphate aminotransferase; AltName: Full=Imidazole acetol-phosphate transaminase [Aquifex aeolicus VF5]AAC07813.1 histidinol-phosphate aminotransferase [Aquifex aeolicus VF5]